MANVVKIIYTEKFKGKQVRDFSEEVHGSDYEKIAEEFRSNNKGEVFREGTSVVLGEPEFKPDSDGKRRIIAKKKDDDVQE